VEAAEPAMEPGPGADIMEGAPMVGSAPGAEKILAARIVCCCCKPRGVWNARKNSSDFCGNPEIGGRTFPAITGIAAIFAPPSAPMLLLLLLLLRL